MIKFCMSVDIQDIITCANFCVDRLRGLGVARGRISRFPIDLRRRPYNTLAPPCECVMNDIEPGTKVVQQRIGTVVSLVFNIQNSISISSSSAKTFVYTG